LNRKKFDDDNDGVK